MQKKNVRRALGIAGGLALILSMASACPDNSANSKEAAQQAAASQNLVDAQPVPAPPYSVMRQQLAEIRNLEAQGDVATTSFEFQNGIDHPVKQCASMGLPIPANASLSNPQQVVYPYTGNGGYVVGQMEPNGTYPSGSTTGTYVMCIQPNGKARATYWEGDVHAESGAAHWDTNTKTIVSDGDTSYHFSTHCVMQPDGNGKNVPVCS